MNFSKLLKKKHYRKLLLLIFAFTFILISNMFAKQKQFDVKAAFLPDSKILKSLLKDINHAQKNIYIAIYMFKTDDHKFNLSTLIEEALFNALKRGVQVYLIMDVGENKDLTTKFNKDTGEELKKHGAKVVYDSPKRRLHAKVAVIDEKIVYIGSHNYTHSAMKYNHETTVKIISKSFADEVIKYIRSLK